MNERYYYFANIKNLASIAREGIKTTEWNEEAGINGINFCVGEDGVLNYIKEISDKLKSVPETVKTSVDQYFGDSVCLSLNLNDIEAQIRETKGICSQSITPDRISVVTVKNLVSDKVSNFWKDFAKKILAEKEKMITPYLVEETELEEFIKENPTLQISKFAENTSLEKRQKENIFTKFFNKIKTKWFARKQNQMPNMQRVINNSNADFTERLATWAENTKENVVFNKETVTIKKSENDIVQEL